MPENLAEVEGGGDPPAVNESADLTTTTTADVPVPPKHDATTEASLPATPEPTADPPITSSISAPSSSSTTPSKPSSGHLPKFTPAFHLPNPPRRSLRQTKLTEARRKGRSAEVPQPTGSGSGSQPTEEPPPPPPPT